MAGEKPHGDKTHAQQQRIIEHKDGPNVPTGGGERIRNSPPREPRSTSQQESRDHHKHNNPGQEGHRPQTHSPAEERH
ncbi:hypothetical protein [Methylobacterium radiodurans]|uniref:Uncharacterized protein n=1 Tax=Methylobacterium radiodurans TaxID=2202828 RepID=A0A2U8VQR9_9HYPH|nr:hypothetical protein [Methylobacterium radiodurans]AWN36023.1 hypothetical protein DK427_10030 [Methylobacterium radiodurans]